MFRRALCLIFLTCCSCLAAQDLTGYWIDDQSKLYVIQQNGTSISLETAVGQTFTGTLTGNVLRVSCKLTEPFIPKDKHYPQWVINELLKQDIVVDGTLSDNSLSIDATRFDVYGDWKASDSGNTSGNVTIRKSNVTLSLGRLAIKAEWRNPDDRVAAAKYTLTLPDGTSMPAMPLKYSPREALTLDVSIDTSTIPNLIPGTFALDGAMQSLLSGQAMSVDVTEKMNGSKQTLFSGLAQFDVNGKAAITFPDYPTQKDVLNALGTAVNLNALNASVSMAFGQKPLTAGPDKTLHIIRQKGVVFFPGVFGSKIRVNGINGDQEVYTATLGNIAGNVFSRFKPDMELPFELLRTNRDGSPVHNATGLDLLEKVAFYSAYSAVGNNQEAITAPAGHPKLRKDGSQDDEPYYVGEVWPYDWRLKVEAHLDSLRGTTSAGCTDIRPLYTCPPSVDTIVSKLKDEFWFLDDKLAAVGHSTGGLIVRAALADPMLGSRFDKGFFVTVPFWGAPKAYYVYLTGNMDPITPKLVPSDLLRRMAPNMAIIYHLAPTDKYPDPVVERDFGRTAVKRADVEKGILEPLIREAKGVGKYPRDLDDPDARCEASQVFFTPGVSQNPEELNEEKLGIKLLSLAEAIPGDVFPPGDKELVEGVIEQVQGFYDDVRKETVKLNGYGMWVRVDWNVCSDADCTTRVDKYAYQLIKPRQMPNRAYDLNKSGWDPKFIDGILNNVGSLDYSQTMDYARSQALSACPEEFRNPDQQWKEDLETEARAFHANNAGTPAIGWPNTYAFYSNAGNTPGAVYVNKSGVNYRQVQGDGTVPCISQQARGDFLGTVLHIGGDPNHVDAANSESVWREIVDILAYGQTQSDAGGACDASPLNTDKPPPTTESATPPASDGCPTNPADASPDQIQKAKTADENELEIIQRFGPSATELSSGQPSKRPGAANSLWNKYVDYYDNRAASIAQELPLGQPQDLPPMVWSAYKEYLGTYNRGTGFQAQVTALLQGEYAATALVISNAGLLKDSDPNVKYVDQLVAASNAPDATVDSYSNKSRRYSDYATEGQFFTQIAADARELLKKYGGQVEIRRQYVCGGKFALFGKKVQVQKLTLIYDEKALQTPNPPQAGLQALEARIQDTVQMTVPGIKVLFSDGKTIHK